MKMLTNPLPRLAGTEYVRKSATVFDVVTSDGKNGRLPWRVTLQKHHDGKLTVALTYEHGGYPEITYQTLSRRQARALRRWL